MSELKECTVEDIALEMGDAPFGSNLKTKDYTDNGALVVQGKNVQGRCFDWTDKRHVTFEKHASIPRSHCYPGDLIFPKVGTIGKVGVLSECEGYEKYLLSTNTMRLKVDPEKANPEFIYYYFTWSKTVNLIHAMNSKSVQPVFNFTTLKKFPLELPSLEVQNEVGRILSELDNKIELNRQTNQTLEHIAQAIFKSWFVDFDPTRAKIAAKENGQDPERAAMAAISGKSLDELEKLSLEQQEQLKTTAALFPDTLVDSELGEMPEGWKITSVGDHVYVTKGRSYKSAELQESTTALVTLKSFMRGGGYREDGLKEYTGAYKQEQVIEPGELVMSLTDVTQAAEIVGKPAIVTRNDAYEILVASLDVAILRPNEAINKEFFYGLMSTYRFHRYAESFATGTTVLHLNPKGITSFEYAQPEDKLCKIYSEIAAPMLSKHEGNIHLSRSLEHLRDALLPRLLAGEMEITGAN